MKLINHHAIKSRKKCACIIYLFLPPILRDVVRVSIHDEGVEGTLAGEVSTSHTRIHEEIES